MTHQRLSQDEKDELIRKHYSAEGPEGMLIPYRQRKWFSGRAALLGVYLCKEKRLAIKRAAAKASRAKKDAPTDDGKGGLPDENIKVSSIFRVGQRYAAQGAA